MIVKLLVEYNENDSMEGDRIVDMLNVGKYKTVLYDFDQWLRGLIKYEGVEYVDVQKARDKLWEGLRDFNLDIND